MDQAQGPEQGCAQEESRQEDQREELVEEDSFPVDVAKADVGCQLEEVLVHQMRQAVQLERN